eukprot:2355171-Pleurochrysis_carterae.AAC.1
MARAVEDDACHFWPLGLGALRRRRSDKRVVRHRIGRPNHQGECVCARVRAFVRACVCALVRVRACA